MKLLNNKILVALFPVIFFAVFGLATTSAQVGGSCDVISATFDTSRQLGTLFFVEGNVPYVYIDITTQGCSIGESFEISIFEEDSGPLDFGDDTVDGTTGWADNCSQTNFGCIDSRTITVTAATTNNFTLAFKAGEDECEQSTAFDCSYYIQTTDEVSSFMWTSGADLDYECEGLCQLNWQYLGIIPFDTTHADDPDDQDGTGSTVVDGNGSTVIDGNGSTVVGTTNDSDSIQTINLNLPNPLAGTVDTLPEFFKKLIDIVIKIGIPLIAIAIVYSGLLFVTARGNEEQLKTAKNTFLFAVIGGLILLASWLIAEAIKDALTTLDD